MIDIQTRQLLDLLQENDTLKNRGFSVSPIEDGRIVIDRFGHVHGMWDHDGSNYLWVSPSSSDPMFHTADAQAALLYTLVVLGKV